MSGRPRWFAVCSALALCVLMPGAAGATFAGANGAIAFVRDRHIWIVNADGSGLRQLTTDFAGSPAWSPDGSTVAFEGGGGIMTMRADGSGARTIVDSPFLEAQPTWSPDGREIAFVRTTVPIVDECDDQVQDVYAARVDGSGERRLTTGLNVGAPAWSPDGRTIAITSRPPSVCDEPNLLSLVDVASGSVGPLFPVDPPIDSDADWSPDGRSLAFTRNQPTCTPVTGCLFSQEIAVGSPDGAQSSLLTNLYQADTEPTWSPDGRLVAFVTLREALTSDDPATLYVMGASGADPRPVRAGLQGEQPAWQPLPPVPAPTAAVPPGSAAAQPVSPAPPVAGLPRLRGTMTISATRIGAGEVLRIRVTLSRPVRRLALQLQRRAGERWVGVRVRRVSGAVFDFRIRPSTAGLRTFRARLGAGVAAVFTNPARVRIEALSSPRAPGHR